MKLIAIRPIAVVFVAAFVVVLGACAPLTKVVLLPQADGSASAVLVKTAKYEQLLSTPYQRVTAQEDKELKADTTFAAEVQKAYPQL